MVPTFTCGLVRSNFALDTVLLRFLLCCVSHCPLHIYGVGRPGAHDRNRTGDLVLTKDVLCRLSYMGDMQSVSLLTLEHTLNPASTLERVMGIEPTPSAWKAEVLPLNYTRLRRLVRALRSTLPT